MQTRPAALSDSEVAAAVRSGWGLPAVSASYEPVGYGSHHWLLSGPAGERWFASVDAVPDGPERLAAALTSVPDAPWAVRPLRTVTGEVVVRLGPYALAVHPYVSGRSGGFSDAYAPDEAAAVGAVLAELHASPAPYARTDELRIPDRAELERALAGASLWTGPYGAGIRTALEGDADRVREVLAEHDRLVAAATIDPVLTHGEPHQGNLLWTAAGPVLIDWETALLAPPERDLWLVDARSDGAGSAAYESLTGRAPDPGLLRRYELAWGLADLASFLPVLLGAGEETADTAWQYEAFIGTLAHLGG